MTLSSFNDDLSQNIGVEVRAPIRDQLIDWYQTGLISHVQVTLPNIIHRESLASIWDNIPTILHSNLLNVMGSNDFIRLGLIAESIAEIPCEYIIEHFTLLRSKDKKFGIAPYELFLSAREHSQNIIANIDTWQKLTGKKIALENTPVTEGVDEYFQLFAEVISATDCLFVCDLPHLLISAIAAGWDYEKLTSALSPFHPIQIHLSGLSHSSGILTDNHKSLEPNLFALGRKLFPYAKIYTIEQEGTVSAETVEAWLHKMRNLEKSELQDPELLLRFFDGLIAPSISAQNAYLTSEAAALFGASKSMLLKDSVCFHQYDEASVLTLFDQLTPFVSPLSILQKGLDQGNPFNAVSMASAVCKRSSALGSWIKMNRAPEYTISFGQGLHTDFVHKSFCDDQGEIDETVWSKSKFVGKAFWLEIATPKLSLKKEDR